MIRVRRFVLISVLAATCGSVKTPAQEPQTSVVGLSVAHKDPDSRFDQSLVPSMPVGTQVYVRIQLAGRTVLRVNGKATQIELRNADGEALEGGGENDFAFFASIAEDRQSVIVPIKATAAPAPGTTSLRLEGEIACDCGSDPTSRTADVKIAVDEELTLGELQVKVTTVDDGFEPDAKMISFESKSPFDALSSVEFLDTSGEVIESSSGGSSSFGFADEMTYSRSYQVKSSPEKIAKIKVAYFQKVETVKVPVDLKFGLDLGQ
jgi:hypothetical protein